MPRRGRRASFYFILFFHFHPLLPFGFPVNVLEAAVASVGPVGLLLTVSVGFVWHLFLFFFSLIVWALILVSNFLISVYDFFSYIIQDSIKHTTV